MIHEDEWLARVHAWRASGLSASEYCKGKAFTKGSLLTWSSRLGRAGKVPRSQVGRKASPANGSRPSPLRFARLVPSTTMPVPSPLSTTTSSVMTVVIGSSRIEVSSGFDPSLLRSVVDVLAGGAR